MKITVRVHGVLEAEMEFPEASVSSFGIRDWNTWHGNQYVQAKEFVAKCAAEAIRVIKAQRSEEEPNA